MEADTGEVVTIETRLRSRPGHSLPTLVYCDISHIVTHLAFVLRVIRASSDINNIIINIISIVILVINKR